MKKFYILLVFVLASAAAMGQSSVPEFSVSGVNSLPGPAGKQSGHEMNLGKKPQTTNEQITRFNPAIRQHLPMGIGYDQRIMEYQG